MNVPARSAPLGIVPPDCPEQVQKLLRTIVTFIPDHGPQEIARQLVPAEREAMDARLKELSRWLADAPEDAVASEINRLRLGFGIAGEDPKASWATAKQYAAALKGIPLWAIKRACVKFAAGDVRPEEVSVKAIDWRYPPSSGMIGILARKMVEPFGEEQVRINRVLGAVVPVPVSPADERGVAAVQAYLAEKKDEADAEREGRMRLTEAQKQEGFRRVRDEWARLGLAEPEWKPNQIPCSPSTYLSLGWKIETIAVPGGSQRVLVPPGRTAVGSRAEVESY